VRPYQDALIRDLGLTQAQADGMMREIALEAIARRPVDYLLGSLRFSGLLLVGAEERLQSHWKQRANKDWAEQWDNRLDHLVEPVAPWAGSPGASRPGPPTAADQQLLAKLTDLYQPAHFGWLLVPLYLAGCVVAARRPLARPALLVAAVALLLLALSAFLDGPVPRYRHPVDPLLAVIAGGGLVGAARGALAVIRRSKERFGRQLAPSAESPSPARGRLG
jgi:hypothetical protein